MKFGRRAFLQFAAGMVGGTLLSPLPWKMADDSAIWSQNWSWRPSPERGHITKVATTCVLCDGGCGIQARLVNGKNAVLLEGNPGHPVNKGGICPLGASGLQFLYGPYRIPQPLKQTRKRGDLFGFQTISWSEALSELTGRLAKMRSEGNSSGLACITAERTSSMDDLWRQFMTAYGSPNFFKMPSHADSLALAASLATGHEAPPAFALERASYVLSFGASLVEGWGAACRMQAAYGSWQQETGGKRAVRLVQVESRCSMTAAKADRWVAVAPGAEAALALGIAHVMIKENLYDAGFVSSSVLGFDDWTDDTGKSRQGFKSFVLASYSPDQIAGIAGISAGAIQELAREFAAQPKALAVWGENQGDMPNNIYHDLAFLALNVLKGNLKPGGTVSPGPVISLGPLPEVQTDALARKGMDKGRLDLSLSKKPILPGNNLYGFLHVLDQRNSYPIEVLMVHEANPVYSLPENALFHKAMQNVSMLVSFSSYMDETAMHADLILPNHTAFERLDDAVGLPGAPYGYYAVASPILPPLLDTKSTGDAVLELAKSLGDTVTSALPWKNYGEFLRERVNGLASSGRGAVADKPGLDLGQLQPSTTVTANYKDGADLWKKLAGGMCWYDSPADFPREMKTSSGKIELAFQLLQKKGLTVDDDNVYLPRYAPLPPSGGETEYPLLVVNTRMMSLSDRYLANPPFMTKTLWDFVLKGNDQLAEINPQTARSLSMAEGDKVVLKTPRGEVGIRVHLSAGARPGVVYLAQGLGHEAYDEYIQDKGVNANSVTEVQIDPVTGLGTVWSTRAQLSRA
jgi:anaerobic selenocysteine-containing dehydrogenase